LCFSLVLRWGSRFLVLQQTVRVSRGWKSFVGAKGAKNSGFSKLPKVFFSKSHLRLHFLQNAGLPDFRFFLNAVFSKAFGGEQRQRDVFYTPAQYFVFVRYTVSLPERFV